MLSFKNRNSNRTYIIAHRGASAYKHENTIEAFQKAIDMGADAIELDIRKSKDDVLLVHHDASLSQYEKPISKMIFSEIREFNKKSDYQVPTLKEVLLLCKDKISLDIELKEIGYEKSVVELALQYFMSENILFTSFRKKALEAIHAIDNNINAGYLFHKPLMLKSIPQFVDFVLPNHALCKVGYLNKLKKLSKPIIIWTVDKQKTKEKYKQRNIFALITNDPVELD